MMYQRFLYDKKMHKFQARIELLNAKITVTSFNPEIDFCDSDFGRFYRAWLEDLQFELSKDILGIGIFRLFKFRSFEKQLNNFENRFEEYTESIIRSYQLSSNDLGFNNKTLDSQNNKTVNNNIQIHKPAGAKLLHLAEFLFSAKTYQETFLITFGDWQEEYFKALHKKEMWKARWINVRYTYAFIMAMWQKSPIGDLIEFVRKIAN